MSDNLGEVFSDLRVSRFIFIGKPIGRLNGRPIYDCVRDKSTGKVYKFAGVYNPEYDANVKGVVVFDCHLYTESEPA